MRELQHFLGAEMHCAIGQKMLQLDFWAAFFATFFSAKKSRNKKLKFIWSSWF
jgi:hypothetical protein